MILLRSLSCRLLALCLPFVAAAPVAADDRMAADLLPPTTIAYAELSRPAALVDLVLTHPLRAKLESIDDYRKALEQKNVLQFKAVVSVVESQIGMTWSTAVGQVTGGGVAVAVDAESEGVAWLSKASSEATLAKVFDTIIRLSRDDAKQKGNPDPFKSVDYRGITAYEAGEAKFAVLGPYLLVTNKGPLGKAILDQYLDKTPSSLAAQPRFLEARQSIAGSPTAWGYVDIGALREAGAAGGLFKGEADNPLTELLLGGILGDLQEANYATAAVDVRTERLELALAIPHRADWSGHPREYFFGPKGEGSAPPLLGGSNVLFSASAYRDIAGMWLRAGDLFNDNVNDGLAQADSNLSTLFSGKDFGEDILGAVSPLVQLVAVRQDFSDRTPAPAIRLPSFAAAFQLKEPDRMRSEFRRIFQSLVGFLNVVGAMNGQPQLELDMERQGESEVISAKYVPEDDERNVKDGRINFNFSPAVAFANDRFIVSSTRELAMELLTASGERPASAGSTNTQARINVAALRDVLADNRSQLVAQNMLEKGHSKEEAEAEIGAVLAAIGALSDASVRLDTDSGRLRLVAEVKLSGN